MTNLNDFSTDELRAEIEKRKVASGIVPQQLTAPDFSQVIEMAQEHIRMIFEEGFDDADLFALVCDQPAAVLRALDQDDWLALKEKVLDFLPRRFREAAASLSRAPGA